MHAGEKLKKKNSEGKVPVGSVPENARPASRLLHYAEFWVMPEFLRSCHAARKSTSVKSMEIKGFENLKKKKKAHTHTHTAYSEKTKLSF